MASVRFRFGSFLISPGHRAVRQGGVEVPLIPRYFDLLLLLLTHRHRVVTRQEIFDTVWSDVVVSDGALSQAIRTIRRSLGDNSRESQFIRTVPRHGYQFVGASVIEETDDGPIERGAIDAEGRERDTAGVAGISGAPAEPADADRFAAPLATLLRRPPSANAPDEERREAAEELHALDTTEALRRLDGVTGHAEARAILRDTRWDVAGAGDVPVLSSPQPWATAAHLIALRLRRGARASGNRWGTAALGGMAAGTVAGIAGGIGLWLVPESAAHPDVILALAAVGAVAGALGAAGVGAGLAAAEAVARSARAAALIVAGAAGGLASGLVAHALARAVLAGVFGRDLPMVGGWIEGLVLGAAAGGGYALSTAQLRGGGLAAPRGAARARAAILTGTACAAAAILLTLAGRHLVGSSLDVMATAFDGSDVGLAPLARLLGEDTLRPMTRTLISAGEGLLFGAGVAFGLTHRPG